MLEIEELIEEDSESDSAFGGIGCSAVGTGGGVDGTGGGAWAGSFFGSSTGFGSSFGVGSGFGSSFGGGGGGGGGASVFLTASLFALGFSSVSLHIFAVG